MPTIALIDSGLGLVSYADALLAMRPDVDLVLSMDPEHMPYGARTPDEVRELVLASARATLPFHPDAVVVACNTASVHGLVTLREHLEPAIPVIGTVPAIRPAALRGGPIAVWATDATTRSDYLRGLVDAFAQDLDVALVPCHDLAEAIESGNAARVDAAIAEAAAATPPGTRDVVLGCTHYGLVADRIHSALAGPEGVLEGVDLVLHDSPEPVARQTLRRLGWSAIPDASAIARVDVLQSGLPGQLPETMGAYAAGTRLLARAAARS